MDDHHFTYITELKNKKNPFSCFVALAKSQRRYELCLTSLKNLYASQHACWLNSQGETYATIFLSVVRASKLPSNIVGYHPHYPYLKFSKYPDWNSYHQFSLLWEPDEWEPNSRKKKNWDPDDVKTHISQSFKMWNN